MIGKWARDCCVAGELLAVIHARSERGRSTKNLWLMQWLKEGATFPPPHAWRNYKEKNLCLINFSLPLIYDFPFRFALLHVGLEGMCFTRFIMTLSPFCAREHSIKWDFPHEERVRFDLLGKYVTNLIHSQPFSSLHPAPTSRLESSQIIKSSFFGASLDRFTVQRSASFPFSQPPQTRKPERRKLSGMRRHREITFIKELK